MEQRELSDIAGENVKQYSHFDKQFDSFLENSTCIYHVTQEYSSPKYRSKENMSFFKMDKQPGSTVQHREPYSILCNKLHGKRI